MNVNTSFCELSIVQAFILPFLSLYFAARVGDSDISF